LLVVGKMMMLDFGRNWVDSVSGEERGRGEGEGEGSGEERDEEEK
jgi:hypothetical protein